MYSFEFVNADTNIFVFNLFYINECITQYYIFIECLKVDGLDAPGRTD